MTLYSLQFYAHTWLVLHIHECIRWWIWSEFAARSFEPKCPDGNMMNKRKWGCDLCSMLSRKSFNGIPTCCSAVRSYVEFIACSGLCNRKLVVLSVGRFPFVPQVHSQLVMSRICDFMEVGETCDSLIRVSWESSMRDVKCIRREDDCSHPARTHHSCSRSQRYSSSSSCKTPAFHSGVWGEPEGEEECHNSFTIITMSTAKFTVVQALHNFYDHILFEVSYGFRAAINWTPAGWFTHHPSPAICRHVTVNLDGLALLSSHVDGIQTRGRLTVQ